MSTPRTAADIVRALPTPEDMYRSRIGKALSKGPTKLEQREADDKADEKALERWRTAVYTRDRYRCRVCKRKVVRSLRLQADRAEAHHIIGRSFKPLRTDRRNGICCCPKCHEDLERNRVLILGKAKTDLFTLEGKSYLNGDSTGLQFVENKG